MGHKTRIMYIESKATGLNGPARIASGEAAEHSESIARGIAWGQHVADEIWAWRSTDGFSPAPRVASLTRSRSRILRLRTLASVHQSAQYT
jgi:hypothetical protein